MSHTGSPEIMNTDTQTDVAIPAVCRILEMITSHSPASDSTLNIPTDPRVDIETLTAGDDDPQYAIVEVLRRGLSEVNNRHYSDTVVDDVNMMVVGAHGFLGHPNPDNESFEFREPQCIFVGAQLQIMQDGIHRSIGKAYIFKSSKLREWIPKSIAAGNPMTVSINGIGDVIPHNNYIEVVRISKLQSIDWANPGTEGMCTSQALNIVKEMKDMNNGGNEMADNNPTIMAKDIISNVTVTELKAYAPTAVANIIEGISVTELQNINPKLYGQIQESGKITEMQVKIGGTDKAVKLTEMQGIIDGFEKQIKDATDATIIARLTEFRNTKIADVTENADQRTAIANRIVVNPDMTETKITEMIDNEIAYLRQMGGMDNKPIGSARPNYGGDMRDAMKSLFGVPEVSAE